MLSFSYMLLWLPMLLSVVRKDSLIELLCHEDFSAELIYACLFHFGVFLK